MSIAFNVNNAGPISQVGVALFSFDTSFWIASNAYGWYKNREQILTFEKILGGNGITLRQNNFDTTKYNNQRTNHGNIWAAYSNGMKQLSRVILTDASTARMGSSGLWCLRALVTGLLCFVRQEAIQTILSDILPECLLDFELEGGEFRLEGPFRAALNRLIEEVASEESVDQFLDKLHGNLDSKIQSVSNGSGLSDVLECQQLEIPQIIGLLRWHFTSVHQRTYPIYPTASLRVWGLAFVLHELGFEVDVSMNAISDPLQYEEVLQERQYGFPKVFLVLHRKVVSDPDAPMFFSTSASSYKPLTKRPPRLIPVQGIPALIIQELVEEKGCTRDDLIAVEGVFFETFEHVNQHMNTISYIRRAAGLESQIGNTTYSSPRNRLDAETINYLKHLFPDVRLDDSNELLQAMLSPLRKYIPTFDQPNRLLLATIIYSSLLATAAIFIRHETNDVLDHNQFEIIYDYPITTETHKDISKNYPRIYVWLENMLEAVSAIRKIFDGGDDLFHEAFQQINRLVLYQCRQESYLKLKVDWSRLLFQLITSSNSTQPGASEFFGVQAHGLCLISDFILDPSVDCSKPLVYHLQRGQLLDIALKDGWLIDARTEVLPPTTISFNPDPQFLPLKDSSPFPPSPDSEVFRWEIQPHWEADSRASCLMIRSKGIPRAQLQFSQLLHSIYDETTWKALCRDETDEHEHLKLPSQLITDSHCAILPLYQMLVEGKWSAEYHPGPTENSFWLIDARGSEILLLLAIAIQFSDRRKPDLRIITNCLTAGYQMAVDRTRNLSGKQQQIPHIRSNKKIAGTMRFLIILINEDSTRNWLRIGSTGELRPRYAHELEVEKGASYSMRSFLESES